MRSETHVETFLSKTMKKALERVRGLLPEGEKHLPAILCEDFAPGHVGDEDGYLKKVQKGKPAEECNFTGWISRRREVLKKLDLHRCILPKHSTPTLMQNDQIHQSLHRSIRKRLKSMVGLDTRIQTLEPWFFQASSCPTDPQDGRWSGATAKPHISKGRCTSTVPPAPTRQLRLHVHSSAGPFETATVARPT